MSEKDKFILKPTESLSVLTSDQNCALYAGNCIWHFVIYLSAQSAQSSIQCTVNSAQSTVRSAHFTVNIAQ